MSKVVLAVTPSIKLRPAQATLYAFILDKYKSGETITLNQVIEQYTRYGCRNRIGDKPAGYHYDWKENGRYHLVPLEGDELKTWALQWFVRNLGIFVVKGLLTAIPTMELSSLQIEE